MIFYLKEIDKVTSFTLKQGFGSVIVYQADLNLVGIAPLQNLVKRVKVIFINKASDN